MVCVACDVSLGTVDLSACICRETDVHQLNEQNEYLKIFTNKYRKMELQVETYESILAKMEEDAKYVAPP